MLNHQTVLEGAEAIRKLGRQLKAIAALGDALESVGSVEQMSAEACARAESMRLEAATVAQGLAEAKAALEAAKAEAAEVLKAAEATKADVLAKAQTKAKSIVEQAERDAEASRATAKADYALAESGLESIRKEHEGIAKELAEKTAKLANVDAQLKDILSKFGGDA